jgi:preprotein translocase subunit YajC
MLLALILFAQGEAPKTDNPLAGPLLPMLAMVAAFFLLVVLPANRREKKQREAILTNLKKNDEVLTSSGIIGVVQNLREGEDEVTLRLDGDCKVRMLKSSIVKILKAKEAPKETEATPPTKP